MAAQAGTVNFTNFRTAKDAMNVAREDGILRAGSGIVKMDTESK